MKQKPRWMISVVEAARDESAYKPIGRRIARLTGVAVAQSKPTLARV